MIWLLALFFIHASNVPEEPGCSGTGDFRCSRVQFVGNHAVSDERLQVLAQPYLNRVVSERDLDGLKERVALLYRSRGYQVEIPMHHSGESLTLVIKEKAPRSERSR